MSPPPPQWETKFRTHTAQLAKLHFCTFESLGFLIWEGKTKDFELNNSKYSPNLIYSWFHHECHSELLASSPSIRILPPFQTIHYPSSSMVLSWVRCPIQLI
jgi:hypothetical protein